MIKNFNDWSINESETPNIERQLNSVVLECVRRLHPMGGNSNPGDNWHEVDPMFDKNDGPDIF